MLHSLESAGDVDRERVLLHEVVADAVETTTALVGARRQTLGVRVPVGLFVECDAVRLTEMFVNVLAGVSGYAPEGGHLDLESRRDGKDIVTRVGIPADGTQLSVRLPAAQIFSEPPTKKCRPVARGTKRRVLIVEDHADTAQMLAEFLLGLGHDPVVARDGSTALDALDALDFEVVLLDIGLPSMDGFEVARRLRARPTADAICLVAITGHDSALPAAHPCRRLRSRPHEADRARGARDAPRRRPPGSFVPHDDLIDAVTRAWRRARSRARAARRRRSPWAACRRERRRAPPAGSSARSRAGVRRPRPASRSRARAERRNS
jgi:CheY-like chemotaxis protein